MFKTLLTIVAVVALLLVGAFGAWLLFHGRTGATPTDSSVPGGDERARQAAELLQEGMAAYHASQPDRARTILQDLTDRFPETWAAKKAWLQLGDTYLLAGDKRMALEAFQKGLEAADTSTRPSVERAITDLQIQIAHADQTSPDDAVYTVQPGDTLSAIARRFNTRVELIKLANNQFKDDITAGRILKVSGVRPEIDVDCQKFKLYLAWKGQMVRAFDVGIGKDGSTPLGEFTIQNKLKNPSWWRNNVEIPFGHPDNILGTRWMGLKGSPQQSGYGIHGTTQPESVPGPTSAGCVRMLNRDIEELFEWVPVGTKVTIR